MKALQRFWLVIGLWAVAFVLFFGVDGVQVGMRDQLGGAPKYADWLTLLGRATYVGLVFGSLALWAGANKPLGSDESMFSKTDEKKTDEKKTDEKKTDEKKT